MKLYEIGNACSRKEIKILKTRTPIENQNNLKLLYALTINFFHIGRFIKVILW